MKQRVKKIRTALKRKATRGSIAARVAAIELRKILAGDTVFSEAVIAGLTLLSVMTLAGDFVFEPGSPQAESIYMLDATICLILAGEYFVRLYNSNDRKKFLSMYWFEPLAFIPAAATAWASGAMAGLLRLLRLVRVYRVVTIMGRESRYTRIIIEIIREARLLQLLIIFLLGLSFTSLAVFMAEATAPGSNIDSLSDAFWWSLATVTTVGYGDVVPVTPAGKAVGVALMLFGIAVLGGFISLSSAAVARIVSRHSIESTPAKYDPRRRLVELAGRVDSLTDEELVELLGLITLLSGRSPTSLLPLGAPGIHWHTRAPTGKPGVSEERGIHSVEWPSEPGRSNQDDIEPFKPRDTSATQHEASLHEGDRQDNGEERDRGVTAPKTAREGGSCKGGVEEDRGKEC